MTTATSPTTTAAQMRAADRAAEDRVNAPVVPRTPASLRKPDHPVVAALKTNADAIRAEAEATLATADSMTLAANRTGQRIESLQREKTELLNRIIAAESRDCRAELARNRARIHELYGQTSLTAAQYVDLNTAVQSLSWLPLLEKELAILAKMLKARLGEIEKSLAELESTK